MDKVHIDEDDVDYGDTRWRKVWATILIAFWVALILLTGTLASIVVKQQLSSYVKEVSKSLSQMSSK